MLWFTSSSWQEMIRYFPRKNFSEWPKSRSQLRGVRPFLKYASRLWIDLFSWCKRKVKSSLKTYNNFNLNVNNFFLDILMFFNVHFFEKLNKPRRWVFRRPRGPKSVDLRSRWLNHSTSWPSSKWPPDPGHSGSDPRVNSTNPKSFFLLFLTFNEYRNDLDSRSWFLIVCLL